MQAADTIPSSGITITTWIHDIFTYFEPEIIEEIQNTKSRISITFDR
jgi:hypothetical protein